MDTIVIGYDDSPAAEHALERAAIFARSLGSKLIVTSVAPLLTPGPHGVGGPDPADPPELHRALLDRARKHLETEGIEAEYVNGFGDPAKKIVELATDRGADLIMVGTREAGFVQRMLGESVSSAVTHKAHCDVYIAH